MRYYLDCEFDGFGGPLISLALVREDGISDYWVMVGVEAKDEWVSENVVPILWDCPLPPKTWERSAAAMDIAAFLNSANDPIIVSDWPADIRYFCELIEFPMGQMAPIPSLKFEMHRVDAYPTDLEGAVQHNAWWDAMALRYKLTGKA